VVEETNDREELKRISKRDVTLPKGRERLRFPFLSAQNLRRGNHAGWGGKREEKKKGAALRKKTMGGGRYMGKNTKPWP